MPLQLPATARPKCPDPVIETVFKRFEERCKFPDLLLAEAMQLRECETNGPLQKRRAESFVTAAIVSILPGNVGGGDTERLGQIHGSASLAHTLLAMGRHIEAADLAATVLADSVGYKRGDEEGQREIWATVLGHLGAMRRMT